MPQGRNLFTNAVARLKSWEGLLLGILAAIFFINTQQAPAYLTLQNQINLFTLYIERIIAVVTMTFLIINGEIDLSVPSVMGLAACLMAWLYTNGVALETALLICLAVGVLCGIFNGIWIAYAKLSSLVVTLAMLIGYRGLARVFLEDKSITGFPEWFVNLGQKPFLGPFPLSMVIFFILLILAIIILQYSAFGRYVYVIGNNKDVARYAGINVEKVKMILYIASGFVSALAGLLIAARLGAVRGDTAYGFELEIITMVLLGGVSIFGGSGSIFGVLLSILIVLNLRNGMSLANLTGHLQTGVIGLLLIFSVLIPNAIRGIRSSLQQRQAASKAALNEAHES